jgi:hypothetical protein
MPSPYSANRSSALTSAREPSKYRYMQADYVESFFCDGSLLLTTYEKCRTHENLTRRDSREGKANFYFPHGSFVASGIQGVGKRSYMLCTSSTLSEGIMTRFGVDSWIEIVDPPAFADAISRAVPGCLSLRLAPCQYVAVRSVERTTERPIMPDPTRLLEAASSGDSGAVEVAFHAMNREMADHLDEEMEDSTYFLKEAVPFEIEDEFRFVWTVDHDVVDPKVFICKEAAKHCVPWHTSALAR